MNEPPKVFIGYSRKDEAFKDRLVDHLACSGDLIA
jgi:hypothetical protein